MKICTSMKMQFVNFRQLVVAIAILSLPVAMASVSQAGVIVNWAGPSDFEDSTMSFSGFTADQLTDISGPGYYHNHGVSGVVFGLDIELDGVWTNIFTDTPLSNNVDYQINAISTPLLFAQGTVTGLRWISTPDVNYSYHSFTGSTAFEFDNSQPVPEPTSIAIFGFGAIGFAVVGRRARKRKQV